MRFDELYVRLRRSIKASLCLVGCFLVIHGFCGASQEAVGTQQPTTASTGTVPLTTEEVVQKLGEMNFRRSQALHSYHSTRTYLAEYRSSLNTLSAKMVVEVKYLAPDTKEFTIQSSTGSRLIIDKVFARILQAERDAVSTDAQQGVALTEENYDFTMLGYESTPSQSMYVLSVKPKTKNKLLFRGRIWVNADDFALVRIEAEPAKNPSFWIKNSEIEQSYIKVNDFWLPERNHSISSIRIGGRAELTIEYGNYQITAADPVDNATEQKVAGIRDQRGIVDRSWASLPSSRK